jgi:hypothetical protein
LTLHTSKFGRADARSKESLTGVLIEESWSLDEYRPQPAVIEGDDEETA